MTHMKAVAERKTNTEPCVKREDFPSPGELVTTTLSRINDRRRASQYKHIPSKFPGQSPLTGVRGPRVSPPKRGLTQYLFSVVNSYYCHRSPSTSSGTAMQNGPWSAHPPRNPTIFSHQRTEEYHATPQVGQITVATLRQLPDDSIQVPFEGLD